MEVILDNLRTTLGRISLMHLNTGRSTLHTITAVAQDHCLIVHCNLSLSVLGGLPCPRLGICFGLGPYGGKLGSSSPVWECFVSAILVQQALLRLRLMFNVLGTRQHSVHASYLVIILLP